MSVPVLRMLCAVCVCAQFCEFVCSKLGEVTQKCQHTNSRQQFWLFCTVWLCIHTLLICQKTKQHPFIYHVSPPALTLNCAECQQGGVSVSDWLRTWRSVSIKGNAKKCLWYVLWYHQSGHAKFQLKACSSTTIWTTNGLLPSTFQKGNLR